MNKALTLSGFISLLVLAAMWGSSFTFIKIALGAIGPVTIAAGRILLAASLLCLIAFMRKETFPTDKSVWFTLFLIAILGNSLPFFLIGWGVLIFARPFGRSDQT